MRFEIGWARNDEGERIRALLAADGLIINGADWSDIAGYWLVARDGVEVAACIQVAFAKPVARLEFLVIDVRFKGLSRDRIAARMLRAAIGVCHARGARLAAGFIPDVQDYCDVLVARGGQVVAGGSLVIGSLNGRRIENHDDGQHLAGGARLSEGEYRSRHPAARAHQGRA